VTVVGSLSGTFAGIITDITGGSYEKSRKPVPTTPATVRPMDMALPLPLEATQPAVVKDVQLVVAHTVSKPTLDVGVKLHSPSPKLIPVNVMPTPPTVGPFHWPRFHETIAASYENDLVKAPTKLGSVIVILTARSKPVPPGRRQRICVIVFHDDVSHSVVPIWMVGVTSKLL
jgi:hypothetical protein